MDDELVPLKDEKEERRSSSSSSIHLHNYKQEGFAWCVVGLYFLLSLPVGLNYSGYAAIAP